MDRTMKIFFLFCFAVFFFTGCKQNDSKGHVSGPDGAGKDGNRNPQAKLDAKDTQAIAVFAETMKDMNGVFEQMLPLVTNTKGVKPLPNVFYVIGFRLKQSNVLKGAEAPAPKVNPATPPKTGTAERGPQKTPTPVAATCQDSKTAVKIENKDNNGQKYKLYSVVFTDCKKPNSGVVLAQWTIGSNGDMNMSFNVEALSTFPNNAFGQLSDYSKKIGSSCGAHYDLEKKEVHSFSCKNLSQDYKLANEANANKGIYFKTIDFDRTAAKPLKVVAELIDMSKVPWTSLKVVAEDDPSLNEFKVETYPPITDPGDGSPQNANADVQDNGQLQPPPPPPAATDAAADGSKSNDSAKNHATDKDNANGTGEATQSSKPDAAATSANQPADAKAKSRDGEPQQNSQPTDSQPKPQQPAQPGQHPGANPQDPADPSQSEGANPPPQAVT